MVIPTNHLWLVYFQDKKIYVYLYMLPFQLVKIANWFSFLNALFSGGLKRFYGSIFVSSLR